jgi:P-type Cu2+ transporter
MSLPGRGAQGIVNGRSVKVVSPGSIREHGLAVRSERIEQLAHDGNAVVYVLIDVRLVGAIALADVIRQESFHAVSRLKEAGIRCMMVTGDTKEVAKSVAARLGLDEYFC